MSKIIKDKQGYYHTTESIKNTQIRKIGKIVKIIIAKIFIKKLCLFFAEDMKWHSKH